jgi:hypothetical protein
MKKPTAKSVREYLKESGVRLPHGYEVAIRKKKPKPAAAKKKR